MSEISVIVPCFNQKDRIKSLLLSLEHQTLGKEAFEVIVSDDGSTDGSRETLQSYAGPVSLKCVFAGTQTGRAHARNLAIAAATGKYAVFLDGDMVADRELLQTHLAALKTGSDIVTIGRVEPVKSQQADVFNWYRVCRGAAKKPSGAPVPPRYFTTNNSGLSLDLLRKAGPFNEEYASWGGEDLEMGYCLGRQGAGFSYVPAALSFHDHPETLPDYLDKVAAYAGDGLRRLIRRCPEHGAQGYLKIFTSANPAARALLNLFFLPPFSALVRPLARRAPSRDAAFRLFDYLSYCRIFHGLKGFRP